MSEIKEKYPYPCSKCPWGYFEPQKEETTIKFPGSGGKTIEIPKNRIYYRCKNPEHEYLIAIDK